MKNSRLFQILYLLLERGQMTANELAGRFEVSIRTIYRDIDALSAAGIPVYMQQGQGGGIRLLEQFRLERTLLGEDDQEQILTALQGLHAVGVGDKEILEQLSGVFQKEATHWLEVDFQSWGASETEQEYFEACKQAIIKRQVLEFCYYNSNGDQGDRVVEPMRLCFRGGNWYLYGYCHVRQGFRLFRLNRMKEMTVTDTSFVPRVLPQEEKLSNVKDAPMIPLELKFSAKAAYRVMDVFNSQGIEALPDGSYLVKTKFPPGEWLVGFLLSFGSGVEVREPQELKQYLKEEAEKIYKLYIT
ncbi:MAG: helix-turn-helix transcriptional regulator [Lachnospiraceae bacterium]